MALDPGRFAGFIPFGFVPAISAWRTVSFQSWEGTWGGGRVWSTGYSHAPSEAPSSTTFEDSAFGNNAGSPAFEAVLTSFPILLQPAIGSEERGCYFLCGREVFCKERVKANSFQHCLQLCGDSPGASRRLRGPDGRQPLECKACLPW